MVRRVLFLFVSILLMNCNPTFLELRECYSNADCGTGLTCSLSTNVCIVASFNPDAETLDASLPDTSDIAADASSIDSGVLVFDASEPLDVSQPDVLTIDSGLSGCDSGFGCISACKLSAPTEIIIEEIQSTAALTISNPTNTSCGFELILANNGSNENPLVSIPLTGTVAANQSLDLPIDVERANFNDLVSAEQSIEITEVNQSFPSIKLTVKRDLGCDGCNPSNIYGGACPSNIVCNGCCSETNQCILDQTSCPVNTPPSASTLSMQISAIKLFQFNWTVSPGASFYRLVEFLDNDIINSEQQAIDISKNISNFDLSVPLYSRTQASYILQACNNFGCTNSNTVTVDNTLSRAIGYFKASNTNADDRFGFDVSISADGTYLAIGAFGEASDATNLSNNADQTDNSIPEAGAVYIFRRIGNAWEQQAYLKSSNNNLDPVTGVGDGFGEAVALNHDGSILAIGAPGEDGGSRTNLNDNSAGDSGAVYIFERQNSSWSQTAYLKASNIDIGDVFGVSLTLNRQGNTLAVGAPFESSRSTGINPNGQSDNSLPNSGATYIFVRGSNGWIQQAYIKAPNAKPFNYFGERLSLSSDGNTLAIGVSFEDSNATGIDADGSNTLAPFSGAAYVYSRQNNNWALQAFIKAADARPDSNFGDGISLSGSGDLLAVGATDNPSGRVYIFSRTNNRWTEESIFTPEVAGSADGFGAEVAMTEDGQTIFVGAPGEGSRVGGFFGDPTDNNRPESGAAYSFIRVNGIYQQQSYFKNNNPDSRDAFGLQISTTDDGSTTAIAAPFEQSNATGIGNDETDDSASRSGAVFLF